MPAGSNPLNDDRFVDFLLYDVLDATALCRLPSFAEHSRETFDPWLSACRRIAREVLYHGALAHVDVVGATWRNQQGRPALGRVPSDPPQ